MTVTLIVPTVSTRQELFARVLRYFSACRMQCPIVVSDHSPEKDLGIVKALVARHPDLHLKLIRHPPEMHFLERLIDCARQSDTPYVHLHADDDFVVPETLQKLTALMDAYPACIASMGLNINASISSNKFTPVDKLPITQTKPAHRLIAQLENFSSVLYALRRREEFIRSLSFAVTHCPDVQFWQYLESCASVLEGEVHVIDDLHYVRQSHEKKWSGTLVREKSREHFPYLMTNPLFSNRVTAFRSALIEACAARGFSIPDDVLDGAIFHLLLRGQQVMGLPPKQFATKDAAVINKLQELLNKPGNSTNKSLARILDFCIQKPA